MLPTAALLCPLLAARRPKQTCGAHTAVLLAEKSFRPEFWLEKWEPGGSRHPCPQRGNFEIRWTCRIQLARCELCHVAKGDQLENCGCWCARSAQKVMQETFPGRKVVAVLTRDILLGGGNIHCITQQEPAAHQPSV